MRGIYVIGAPVNIVVAPVRHDVTAHEISNRLPALSIELVDRCLVEGFSWAQLSGTDVAREAPRGVLTKSLREYYLDVRTRIEAIDELFDIANDRLRLRIKPELYPGERELLASMSDDEARRFAHLANTSESDAKFSAMSHLRRYRERQLDMSATIRGACDLIASCDIDDLEANLAFCRRLLQFKWVSQETLDSKVEFIESHKMRWEGWA